jgi:CTP synthase
MRFSGLSPDGSLVEILELPSHPFFLAVQFHPEFKSKPTKAHPLFARFVAAAIERRLGRKTKTTAENSSESDSSKSNPLAH